MPTVVKLSVGVVRVVLSNVEVYVWHFTTVKPTAAILFPFINPLLNFPSGKMGGDTEAHYALFHKGNPRCCCISCVPQIHHCICSLCVLNDEVVISCPGDNFVRSVKPQQRSKRNCILQTHIQHSLIKYTSQVPQYMCAAWWFRTIEVGRALSQECWSFEQVKGRQLAEDVVLGREASKPFPE